MQPIAKQNCCMHCGRNWPDVKATWPRTCEGCGHESFKNPLPVAVVIVRDEAGRAMLVRRNIPPALGELGLPGGYVNFGEGGCKKAAVRELLEETGIVASADDLRLLDVKDGGHVALVFYELTVPVRPEDVTGVPNEETQEVVWTSEAIPLCFPTHTAALAEWFAERSARFANRLAPLPQ